MEKTVKRVFVNDVDRYSSKRIAEFLSACEAEVASEDEAAKDTFFSPRHRPVFQVVGTVSSKDENILFLHEQYNSPTRDELFRCLLECDVVVYNISEGLTQQLADEAAWALKALHDERRKFNSRKIFILVSSVVPRAITKLNKPDEEPEDVISEQEFTQREPHPKFGNHKKLEKLVLTLTNKGKTKLRGCIIAAGLQYGMGENLFHYFFKISWLMQVPQVPVFGAGTNYIPMIHVYDLGQVIQKIIELRRGPTFICAVDDSKSTLEEIIKAISDVLGPGDLHTSTLEDAIRKGGFTPEEVDQLSIDLRLQTSVMNDILDLNWRCKTGMVDNIEDIIQEYKDTRQLLPVKICLLGPAAVGKTTVAAKLCKKYKIHHISVKEVIQEKTRDMSGAGSDSGGYEEAAAAKDKDLEEIQGQLTEHQISVILKEKLNSKPCRNHGFVLDGLLETYEQAKMIFSDEEPEREDSGLTFEFSSYNKLTTPEYVFVLDASDDFLKRRVEGLPEIRRGERRYNWDEFESRLVRYRELSKAEETLQDFFDHRKIHLEHIEVSTDDLEYTGVMRKITEIVGAPKNYGLSPVEQEEENRRREDERRQKQAAEATERKQRKEALLAEMAAQYKDWQENLFKLTRQECELLEAQANPLRNYLMKFLMPSVVEVTTDCLKIKPDDPVDFLAEHLLRKNNQE
nr:adenylate kinase 7 [Nothobranchius furzeri]XP_054604849.1 adenylate kinase 7 [Nothobranchius furzeri]